MVTKPGFQFDEQGAWIVKGPTEAKDYNISFAKWLLAGDTIASVVWNVPAGLIKNQEGFYPTSVYVKLSGGTLGKAYTVTAHVTTVNGLIDDQSFRVVIRNN